MKIGGGWPTAFGRATFHRDGSRRRLVATLIAMVAGLYALDRIDVFDPVDDWVVETRMAAAPRDATGDIVFVGIDSRSLRQAGSWPWPREVYGEMIVALQALGATEIFFDIDFSSPSNPRSDELFARALADAGGAVILPAFRQAAGLGDSAGDIVVNEPRAIFQDHAWLAAVNFQADRDGRVRRFPWGIETDGRDIPSAPSVLAGIFGPLDETFQINFSILPGSVPSFSAADLLEGKLDRKKIMGRSVVVGGHAIEFSDALSVPVHGVVDGVMLQIIAAETLLQNVVPLPVDGSIPIFVVALIGLCLIRSRIGRHLISLTASFVFVAALVEVLAFYLQARFSIVISTPVLHFALVGLLVSAVVQDYAARDALLSRSRRAYRRSRETLSDFVNDSLDAVIVTDELGRVLEINAEGQSLFGHEETGDDDADYDNCLPQELVEIIVASMATHDGKGLHRALSGRMAFGKSAGDVHLAYTVAPTTMGDPSDATIWSSDKFVCRLTVRDVTLETEQRVRLDHADRFDPLTGAMRRHHFILHLSHHLAERRQTVLVINLHRFRTVNANFGRDVGDTILRAFTDRIRVVDDRIVEVGRIGGDVLTVFCDDVDERDVQYIARGCLDAVAQPFMIDGTAVRLTARVGLASGQPGDEARALLSHAELAMETAREVAGGGIQTFEASATKGQERYLQIEHALWTAIENDEIYLLYQPQVTSRDGRIIAAEALIRWTHPILGAISPGEFIPIAESNGFIERLGVWVLDRACKEAASWPDHVSVAVNVSAIQFQRGNVVGDVYQALNESGLDPCRLQLEITESLFVSESQSILDALHEFRELGIVLALDDFGSGFSSLSYLASLPIDKLKLDRAFVRDLGRDVARLTIVKSVIHLARDLALQFICEGVETEEQCDQLVALGCQQIQGYLFGRPMPLEAFVSAVAQRSGEMAMA